MMIARLGFLYRMIALGLVLLTARLAQLQLLNGSEYRRLAEQNCLRVVPQPAPRGVILDRAGQDLATNRIVFRVAAVPQDLPAVPRKAGRRRMHKAPPSTKKRPRFGQANSLDRDALFKRLGALLGMPATEVEDQFDEHLTSPFLPAELASPVPKKIALRIEEERLRLPGVVVESVTARYYPLGGVAAHVIGYLSQPSADAFPKLKTYGVQPHDLVGRSGLEGQFDDQLRGESGGSLIQVDSHARQTSVVGHRPTTPGGAVTLTIDAGLEALIEHQFGNRPGACVVLQPHTGEVLAMVSMPDYNPQAFADQNNRLVQQWLDDPQAPLMNRATMGVYLPGSIVKTITGMTALHDGVITPQTVIDCPGYVEFGDRKIHCWKRDGHGPVRLREALMVSCNVYFMEVGRKLGIERLRAGYTAAGLGRKTGWPLGERAGYLPTRRMSEGEVAMLAIGQGEILLTPLQAAIMVSAIANGGALVEPWIVQRVDDRTVGKPRATPIGWLPEQVEAVREGMRAVVNDQYGTGIRARSQRIVISGKTGTAQTGAQGVTHGWMIGYCPSDHPLAAFAVVAEQGGSGGDLPASIGKVICEYIADTQTPATEPAPPPAKATPAP